ncbi:Panacea domain-containing protein [Microbacterium sp. Leaf179]|uniref:Panacea domain-containing protein n=1 Tax=Microbacterium sp. Leaf179 TaxID=1736288 RepID=UPI0009E7EC90|nr:type II toxin-antitoxin system antitoxin SocA domain-containing protein [Microbacterium sp. Leaf179]
MAHSSAAKIAASFVDVALRQCRPISNLQLQKLVTLTQSLAVYSDHVPAFAEPVQAWKNGPVIKPLYGLYKGYGDTVIQRPSSPLETSEGVGQLIAEVWDVAGSLSAADLWKLTHTVGPWQRHFRSDTLNIAIPNQELGDAWTAYLAEALRIRNNPTPSTVIGRGQGEFVGSPTSELASLFAPASTRLRSA